MKLISISLIIIVFIAACGEMQLDSICRENGTARPCTEQEQAMIDGMHTIIRQVAEFDEKEFTEKNFVYSGPKAARVSFIGENHTNIEGLIENLAAVNILAEKGDAILLEGSDRRNQFRFDNCGKYLIFRIFLQEEYQKLNEPYEGDGASKHAIKMNFYQIYANTKDSYDISKLNLFHLRCGYWDDDKALGEALRQIKCTKNCTYGNLKIRNRGMTEAINLELPRGGNIFVNTGYGHMPLGEWLQVISINRGNKADMSFTDDYDSFFAHIKKERRLPKQRRSVRFPDETTGSTKVLYKYLKRNNISFREIISRKHFGKTKREHLDLTMSAQFSR